MISTVAVGIFLASLSIMLFLCAVIWAIYSMIKEDNGHNNKSDRDVEKGIIIPRKNENSWPKLSLENQPKMDQNVYTLKERINSSNFDMKKAMILPRKNENCWPKFGTKNQPEMDQQDYTLKGRCSNSKYDLEEEIISPRNLGTCRSKWSLETKNQPTWNELLFLQSLYSVDINDDTSSSSDEDISVGLSLLPASPR